MSGPNVCAVKFAAVGFGCQQASLWVEEFAAPAAVVWYREAGPGGSVLQIAHTFTLIFFRRRGLMRRLFDELARAYPRATHMATSGGTEDGGQAFLQAYGFKPAKPWGHVYRIGRKGESAAVLF